MKILKKFFFRSFWRASKLSKNIPSAFSDLAQKSLVWKKNVRNVVKGVPKVREQIIHPKSFKHWFLSQKMTLFWTPLSGQFCPESNPWRGRFTSVNCIFKVVNFGFPNSILQKKVCGNYSKILYIHFYTKWI